MEYGQEVLSNYYTQYIYNWNKIVAVERTIRNVVVEGVPLKGKLDKLEFDGKSVNVVDYKTGDIDKAKDKLKPPHDKDPNGGDYWRQAVFYKILVDHYEAKNWKVVSTEFDFIEPDKKKLYRKEKIIITPEDITTVTQQIKMVWQKIQERDFYTGCGKPDCHWCNFVKDNHMAVALHDLVEEDDQTKERLCELCACVFAVRKFTAKTLRHEVAKTDICFPFTILFAIKHHGVLYLRLHETFLYLSFYTGLFNPVGSNAFFLRQYPSANGGKIDSLPPRLVSAFPKDSAVNVPLNTRTSFLRLMNMFTLQNPLDVIVSPIPSQQGFR
jgi:hypothetical protein